jgi:UDP-N-acetylmuramyl pentapeptide phosphotransferase/UDP-N-acetylglucosamine-1-phosphate transferase
MTHSFVGIALAAAALTSGAAALIVISQRWHGKHSLDHDLEGVQKYHTRAVPRIGGLALVGGVLVTLLLCKGLVPQLRLPEDHLTQVMLLLIAGLPVFLAGMIEDLTKKVSVIARLSAAIVSALIASWLLGATIDELNIWGVDSLLTWTPIALLVTAVTVAGGVNAVNIIDGFNGLAATTVVVMLAALGVVAAHVGDALVAELALIGAGAAVGFLFINYPTGRLFLGDGGAYFLGFWVAEVAVLLLTRNSSVNAWQVLSICAYPIIEVLFSIYRRKIVRQASPGEPDGLHLHTLVYRRLVPKFFSIDSGPTWKRNAAVSCLIIPWIVIAAILSVAAGGNIPASILVVLSQIVTYLTFYKRIVRGSRSQNGSATVESPSNLEVNTR